MKKFNNKMQMNYFIIIKNQYMNRFKYDNFKYTNIIKNLNLPKEGGETQSG